jgi:small conductance mechanosensitive channel
MTDLATQLNELSQIFDTTVTRSLVTILALALLSGMGWLSSRVQRWLRNRWSDFVADVLTLVVMGVTLTAAVGVTIGVWRFADDVERALGGIPGGEAAGPLVVVTVVVLVVAHLLSRAGRRVVDDLFKRRAAFDEHEVEITYRVFQIALWVTSIAVVLGLWKVDLTGLLVGAGFLGIVVGMAARQTLGSVLAGFVLMFARPFEIGDWVVVGDYEGVVTDISIVNTRVQTFDGEYVMIPNDLVSGQEVVNRSRNGRLRLEVEVSVDYESDLERATTLAGEALEEVDEISSVPSPRVIVKRFDESAVVVGCRVWIDKPSARRKWRTRTAVVQALKTRFDEAGVRIPFPQRELSNRGESRTRPQATTDEDPSASEDAAEGAGGLDDAETREASATDAGGRGDDTGEVASSGSVGSDGVVEEGPAAIVEPDASDDAGAPVEPNGVTERDDASEDGDARRWASDEDASGAGESDTEESETVASDAADSKPGESDDEGAS